MRCDNYCPRCGEDVETVNHAIFECPSVLQAWAHASTWSCPDIFPWSSVYTNLDYLFWRTSEIESKLDKDSYPWIIWYLWKAQNYKLFIGLTSDPMELIRHAQSKCNAWFEANSKGPKRMANLLHIIGRIWSYKRRIPRFQDITRTKGQEQGGGWFSEDYENYS